MYFLSSIKRVFILCFMFISFFAHSQNEVRYQLDDAFMKSVVPSYERGNVYELASLWLNRLDETARKKAFYDFDLAHRNYRKVMSFQMSKDSVELYTNRLWNILDDEDLPLEYKLVVAQRMPSLRDLRLKVGSESLDWMVDGKSRKLTSTVIDSLDKVVRSWREMPLQSLLKYHFPQASSEQNMADFYVRNSFDVKQESHVEIIKTLLKFYSNNGFWKEYIHLQVFEWEQISRKSNEEKLQFAKVHSQNEYVHAHTLWYTISGISKQDDLLKMNSDELLQLKVAIADFKAQYPNSIYNEHFDTIASFMNKATFEVELLNEAYNTPTIFEVKHVNSKRFYYYHFIQHDTRKSGDSLKQFELFQQGMWEPKSFSDVTSTDVFALPLVEAVGHVLFISEAEIVDFSAWKELPLRTIQVPFEAHIHVWTSIPYAIKFNQEPYVNYLVVQELKTGKPVEKVPVFKADGMVSNVTNKHGFTNFQLNDSLHYMVYHRDTFSVDRKRANSKYYPTPLIDWERVEEWFWQFEWYGIEERREDAEFDGFTDRIRYRPGDTVYYKAFAYLEDYRRYDDTKLIPHFLSETNVILTNPDLNVIARDTLKISSSHAVTGSFVIPKNSKLGTYHIAFNTEKPNSYEGLSFSVEDYIDHNYKLLIEDVQHPYKVNDTVGFDVKVESITGQPIAGARIVVEGNNVVTTEGFTNAAGKFHVKTKATAYSSIKCFAHLPSGEVISERKRIDAKEQKIEIKLMPYTRDSSKVVLKNFDDVVQKDTIATLIQWKNVPTSTYTKFQNNAHFTKDEFVSWYPHSTFNLQEIHAEEIMHTKNLLPNTIFTEHQIAVSKLIIGSDTMEISIDMSMKYRSKDLFEVKVQWDKKGKAVRKRVETELSELIYLKRKRNGRFHSKLLKIKNQSHGLLNRSVNKNVRVELFTTDGTLREDVLEGYKLKMSRYNPTIVVWDSLPDELHPGKEYTLQFSIQAGKRKVKREAALWLVKEEHALESVYLTNKKRYRAINDNNRYLGYWSWLTTRNYELKNVNTTRALVLPQIDSVQYNIVGEVRELFYIDEMKIPGQEVKYYVPLIQKDGGTVSGTITREDIARLPIKDLESVSLSQVVVTGGLPANQLSVSSFEIVPNVGSENDYVGSSQEHQSQDNVAVTEVRKRTNFNDTQFFVPQVKRKGKKYSVTFTQNDDLSAWKLNVVTNSRNYQFHHATEKLISVLPVQIVENTPRFMRVGDSLTLQAAVLNRTKDTLKLTPTCNLYESGSLRKVNEEFAMSSHPVISVAPFDVQLVEWQVVVPEYFLDSVYMELSVVGNQMGDRLQKAISIAQRKGIFELGQSFIKLEDDTLTLTFNKNTFLSETAQVMEAGVYLNGSKEIEYLIERGKLLNHTSLITSTQIASHWSLVAEIHTMLANNDVLEKLLQQEFQACADSLRQIKEQPFQVAALTKRMMNIYQLQQLISAENYNKIAKESSEELTKFMDVEGHYKWLAKSDKGSRWATRNIVQHLAKIKSFKLAVDSTLYVKWATSLEKEITTYMDDNNERSWWNWQFFHDLDAYAVLQQQWSADYQKLWNRIKQDRWSHLNTSAQLYFGQLAYHTGDRAFATTIATSILNYTSYSKTKGRFIPEQDRGSELENQAKLILLLDQIGGFDEEIVQLQQFIYLNQGYNEWKNSASPASYLRALLSGAAQKSLLNKQVHLKVNYHSMELHLDKNYQVPVDKQQDTVRIELVSAPQLLIVGGYKVTFMDEFEQVQRSTDNQLRIERLIYWKDNGTWKLCEQGAVIPKGSAVKMDVVLTAALPMSLLKVELPRITGLEFVNSTSGYRYARTPHYAEMKNELIRLYIDQIKEGQTILSFEGAVSNAGTFLFAPTTVTSDFNPEIGAMDQSQQIKVE